MKTYSTGEVIDRRQIDGMDSEDWVHAEAAEGLYAALQATAEKLQLVMEVTGYPKSLIDTALNDYRKAISEANEVHD